MAQYFVTGIGTEIGKTVCSAIVVEALQADYWKPVQAGELDHSDTHKVQALISNSKSIFHPESYRLKAPMSPHAAAKLDNTEINLLDIIPPKTQNHLIVEGAGGLHVPLNDKDLIIDLIQHLKVETILVSKNYLGSINHTLLSIEALQHRKIPIKGIIFNGEPNKETESIIEYRTGLTVLGRVPLIEKVDQHFIKRQAVLLNQYLTLNI